MSGSEAEFRVGVQPETGAPGPPSLLQPMEQGRLPGPGGVGRGHRLLSHRHAGSEHWGKYPPICTIFCLVFSRAILILLSCQLNFIYLSQLVSEGLTAISCNPGAKIARKQPWLSVKEPSVGMLERSLLVEIIKMGPNMHIRALSKIYFPSIHFMIKYLWKHDLEWIVCSPILFGDSTLQAKLLFQRANDYSAIHIV